MVFFIFFSLLGMICYFLKLPFILYMYQGYSKIYFYKYFKSTDTLFMPQGEVTKFQSTAFISATPALRLFTP